MTSDAIAHRRALHQIPELDDELPETLAYVTRALEPFGAELPSRVACVRILTLVPKKRSLFVLTWMLCP